MFSKSCSFALTVLALLALVTAPTISRAQGVAITSSWAGGSFTNPLLLSDINVSQVGNTINGSNFDFEGPTFWAANVGVLSVVSTMGKKFNQVTVVGYVYYTDAVYSYEPAVATAVLTNSVSGSAESISLQINDYFTGAVLYTTNNANGNLGQLPVILGSVYID